MRVSRAIPIIAVRLRRTVTTHQLYIDHADLIEAVLGHTCAARRLALEVCKEFSSWVRLRLIENDSAILRKFAGRSTPRTFLTTVIQRLFLDWRNREWGKWRPSAAARRRGPVAVALERLILRDQLTFEEAVQQLVGQRAADSAAECERVWAELPQRPMRRPAADINLEMSAAPTTLDDMTIDDQQRRASLASAALHDVLSTLDAADHVILRLRFQDGFTVARIAQVVGQEQKALYRRIESVLNRMRQALLAKGVSASDIGDLLGSPVVDFPAAFAASGGKPEIGPSND